MKDLELRLWFEADTYPDGTPANVLYGSNDIVSLKIMIEAPEGCSEDYGYFTMLWKAEELFPDMNIVGQYEGQEAFLAEDAAVDVEVDVDFIFLD